MGYAIKRALSEDAGVSPKLRDTLSFIGHLLGHTLASLRKT